MAVNFPGSAGQNAMRPQQGLKKKPKEGGEQKSRPVSALGGVEFNHFEISGLNTAMQKKTN